MPSQHNRLNEDKAVERVARLASELFVDPLAKQSDTNYAGRPSWRFVRRNLVTVVVAPRPGGVVAFGELSLRRR